MADEPEKEVLFRASKRRKVFRKPAHSHVSNEQEEDVTITQHATQPEQDSASGVTRAPRATVRKHGIAFSSGNVRGTAEQEPTEQQALVVVGESEGPEVLQNERFVRPTGRVDVVEDKHMMAYVDSKLAEFHSAADPPLDTANDSSNIASASENLDLQMKDDNTSFGENTRPTTGQRTVQQAQERSTRVYQRPTKKRRERPERKHTDVARDSMIDQIMKESQIPHYDRSAPKAADESREDVDNDEATAEAFKAQLLADLQSNRRRLPPSRNTGAAPTGPKLGGSRAQREKMRAMEEAKGGTSKK